jgi:aquaporin Z
VAERELERRDPTEFQRLGAEFFGTFFLTLVAAGADIIDAKSGGEIGHTARYFAPGLLVAAMVWSISGISGAHINPAVTFTFVLRRCFPFGRAIGYWIVQFLGAIAAAVVLRLFFGALIAKGATHVGLSASGWQAMSWEALLTGLLVFVILGTAEHEAVVGKNQALAVGLTVALCGLFSSPVSGASMNPARSLGPQLVSGDLSQTWIYLLGPLLGALVATGVGYLLHGPPTFSEHEAAHGKHQ